MKILLLLTATLFADAPKQQAFMFSTPKASCSLLDGKLVLSKAWPLGSWEDCAYAILGAAQQLDKLRDELAKQLAEEKAKVPVCPTKK